MIHCLFGAQIGRSCKNEKRIVRLDPGYAVTMENFQNAVHVVAMVRHNYDHSVVQPSFLFEMKQEISHVLVHVGYMFCRAFVSF